MQAVPERPLLSEWLIKSSRVLSRNLVKPAGPARQLAVPTLREQTRRSEHGALRVQLPSQRLSHCESSIL